MEIVNTQETKQKPPIQMVVYGEGGVGKTTFAAKAPNAVIADCERGTKYLGSRGVDVDVGHIESWPDFKEFAKQAIKNDKYETIVIDPIGELMDKLQRHMRETGGQKLIQSDNSPTMAGWGWLKRNMRNWLKALRDSGKNIVIVGHVEEKDDDNQIVKRPKLQTKLSEELVNMVDIVAYMTVIDDPENPDQSKRTLICDPEGDRYIAKDRTGTLMRYNPPEWHHTNEAGEKVGILDLVYGGDWDERETESDDDEDIPETPDGTENQPVDDSEDEETPDDAISLEEVGLSAGAVEALNTVGFETVSDIEDRPDFDFDAIDGVGPKTLEQINDIIGDDTKDDVSDKLQQHNG